MSRDICPLSNRSLLLLCLCLPGSVVTASQAAEPPGAKPEAPLLKPRPIHEVIDLRDTLRQNGFGDRLDSFPVIQQFARYGSKDHFLKYQKADQFERGDIQKEVEAHQKKIAEQAFILRSLPVATLDLGDFDETKGLPLTTRLGFRVFRTTEANGGVRSGILDSVRPCRADGGDYWFLTKDRKSGVPHEK